MRRIFFIPLILLSLALAEPAHALLAPPYFDDLRSEVTNQLTIASNAVPRSRPLILALKKALKTIDHANPTNLVKDAKSLSLIASTLNKSALSNVFDVYLQNLADIYVSEFTGREDDLSDRLELTYPSRSHTAALNALGKMLTALQTASTNVNTTKAARSIYLAATKFSVALHLVVKAEAAPAPASRVIAKATGAVNTSTFKTTGAAITNPAGDNFGVLGVHGTLGGHIVSFALYGVSDGTSTIPITEAYFTVFGLHGGRNFSENDTGSATVTRISGSKTLYGSFTFTVTDDDDPSASVTVTGTFFGKYP